MKKGAFLVVFVSISILLISCGIGVKRQPTQPTDDGKINLVFYKDFSKSKDVEREEVDELPAYIIMDQVELISGGIHGDVLITSFSKATPIKVRESVLKGISIKEGFIEASLYCTREGYQANLSSSYAEAHPNALKKGYLGRLKEGKFTGPR